MAVLKSYEKSLPRQCSSADEVISSRISDVHHPTPRLEFFALHTFNVSVKTNESNYTCDTRDNPSYRPPAHRILFKNSHYWSPEVKSFSFSTAHSRLQNHLKQTLIFQGSTGSAGLLLTSIRWALAHCHFSCEHERGVVLDHHKALLEQSRGCMCTLTTARTLSPVCQWVVTCCPVVRLLANCMCNRCVIVV